MLDPRLLRTELALVAEQLARRGMKLDVARIQSLEARRKDLQTQVQELQNLRNTKSKAIGKAKASGADMAPLMAEVAAFVWDADAGGKPVSGLITDKIATIGENMSLRRMARLEVPEGAVSAYVHNAVVDGLGKIGVIVALKSAGDTAKLEALGKQVAMHVAAARPEAVDVASVDSTAVDREREVLADQARASGKPEEIVQKMVEGRLRKYYEEVVLMEQTWVIDGESKVKAVIEAAGKDVGAPVEVAGFVRFTLGEGIEKQESDFASEVAATLAS